MPHPARNEHEDLAGTSGSPYPNLCFAFCREAVRLIPQD